MDSDSLGMSMSSVLSNQQSMTAALREAMREVKEPCLESLRSVKERMSERLRCRVAALNTPERSQKASRATKGAASMATTLAVARVFKGNVVAANLFRSVVKGHWVKISGAGTSGGSKDGHTSKRVAAAVAAAGVVGSADSAQAEGAASGLILREPFNVLVGEGKREKIDVIVPAGNEQGSFEAGLKQGDTPPLQRLAQAVTVPVLGTVCHVFMHGLNRTEVYGAGKLIHAVHNRPPGQGLLTACNHVASMDDPLVLAAILPTSAIMDAKAMRWTLCATDRCFKNSAMSAFFRAAKVLPVERGAGVYQKGLDTAIAKLQHGDWVHVFPEGSRSRDGGRSIQTVRRGVGRLVAEPTQPPLLVPFVHLGMGGIIAVGSKLPSMGKEVAVMVGDPIPVDDLVKEYREQGKSQKELYDAVAARVENVLKQLKADLEAKVLQRTLLEPIDITTFPLEWDEIDGKRLWDLSMAQTQRESALAAWLAQPPEALQKDCPKPEAINSTGGRQLAASSTSSSSTAQSQEESSIEGDLIDEGLRNVFESPSHGGSWGLKGFAAQGVVEGVPASRNVDVRGVLRDHTVFALWKEKIRRKREEFGDWKLLVKCCAP